MSVEYSKNTRRTSVLAWGSQTLDIPQLSPSPTGRHPAQVHLKKIERIRFHDNVVFARRFTLVPWRPELLKMRGKEIDISVRDRTIAMVLARRRIRNLELSR